MKSRRGVSLLECLVVMAIASVMLGAALSLIHILLRAERVGLRQVVVTSSRARLARTFRSDAHAARGATVAAGEAGSPRLEFDAGDAGKIAYEMQGTDLARVESGPDQTTRRESFRVDAAKVAFELEGTPPRLVSLTAARRPAGPESASAAPVLFRIDAALNRDRRFAGPAPAQP